MYKALFKRTIDLTVALILFTALLPVFVVLTAVIAISIGNPFFKQKRPGKDEKIFTIIKFRTMSNKRDASGELLPDEKRLVGIGKVIRKLSLDEIPQLLNVIAGDMSLVGPRPLLTEYLPLYNSEQRRRHDVRPGITGWAQVNGRNAINWPEKFNLDIWYVDHVSLALDLKIMALTIKKVIKPQDISSPTSATMEKFRGNALI